MFLLSSIKWATAKHQLQFKGLESQLLFLGAVLFPPTVCLEDCECCPALNSLSVSLYYHLHSSPDVSETLEPLQRPRSLSYFPAFSINLLKLFKYLHCLFDLLICILSMQSLCHDKHSPTASLFAANEPPT